MTTESEQIKMLQSELQKVKKTLNDYSTIAKKAEAQLEVTRQKNAELVKKNNTLIAKAARWEMARLAANLLNEVRTNVDKMPVADMSVGELKRYTDIKDLLDDFFTNYEKELS